MWRVARSLTVSIVVVALLALGASPALAQRDPFDPLVDPNAGDLSAGPTDELPGQDAGEVTERTGSERLADTGFDPSGWLVAAYVLAAAGAAAVVLSRNLGRPPPPRMSRIREGGPHTS